VHRQKFRRGRCWLKNSGQAQRLGRLLCFYGRHQRSEVHWLQTLEGAKIAALESARVTLSPSSTILSQASQRPRSNQSPRAEACQDAQPLVLPLYCNRNSGPSSGQGGPILCQQGRALARPFLAASSHFCMRVALVSLALRRRAGALPSNPPHSGISWKHAKHTASQTQLSSCIKR
jgi:hypothetical protein